MHRLVSIGLAFLFAGNVAAATNVLKYTYDPAGNITQIQRQTAVGFAALRTS
jgi:hypothetical protein